MTILALENVCKSYGEGAGQTSVLKDINLQIEEGEFIAIVGFSGSGKTTLISTIAGLVKPDGGKVTKQGQTITEPGPDRGVVFQSYSLMPWLTVQGNVALAVDQVYKDWPKAKREAHTTKYVEMVGLGPASHKRPAELSGGMRQRVAVARALAASPDILLLDEPLSALDALTRANLQEEILRIWEQDKKTVILITNDVDEGLLMADRVIPLKPGPGATFGPEFVVDLPRPRDRTMMNHDERFKTLRAQITQYLMDIGIEASSGETAITLPPVRPNTSTDWKNDTTALKPSTDDIGRERYLEFTQLDKVYPTPKGPVAVVEDFNLKMQKGEFISLIGHSGCGKSTVLSMCAGLNEISNGGIILDGKEVDSAGPDRAVVFQAPSLFPWLTAFENVSLGVESVYPHAQQTERDDIVEYYLTRVGLGDALHKKAADMSNGMRQRVGIARAFALSPKLLLLDEPFGMLDSLTRWELQEVLMEVWERTKLTAIMVTHDVDEAILLADRVVMMTNGPQAKVGKIIDVDLPRPRTRKALLEHPDYYAYRESLISFLAECDQH
ncbi:MAG TPA: nitrate/sulfonate/bicarbonate ABC transporter ATP-binding protein [Porticoccaceae bacterium]|nr:nitrate/sulfonate/bicarbonate ABC transporter ATP-binding protein [Porticoccaceae bacterium]